MNTILFTISTLLLIVTVYKYYLTDNFKNKISDKMKKLLFMLVLIISLSSCSMMKNLNTSLRTPINRKTTYTTTVVNGHVYHTTISNRGNSYRVHTSGNGINSTTYGHY